MDARDDDDTNSQYANDVSSDSSESSDFPSWAFVRSRPSVIPEVIRLVGQAVQIYVAENPDLESSSTASSSCPSDHSHRTSLLSSSSGGTQSRELQETTARQLNEIKILAERNETLANNLESVRLHNAVLAAKLDAAEARATDDSLEVQKLRRQLEEQKYEGGRKRRRLDAKGRMLTPLTGRSLLEADETVRKEKDSAEAAKQKVRDSGSCQHELTQTHNAVDKNFDAPLQSYTRKDDLRDICVALALERTGTIAVLKERIQTHLTEHPEIAQTPRFVGLTKASRSRKRAAPGQDAPL